MFGSLMAVGRSGEGPSNGVVRFLVAAAAVACAAHLPACSSSETADARRSAGGAGGAGGVGSVGGSGGSTGSGGSVGAGGATNPVEDAGPIDTNTKVTVKIESPYAQFLKIGLSPADLNATSQIDIQNKEYSGTLSYYLNTPVTFSELYKVSSVEMKFTSTTATGAAIEGNPLTVIARDGAVVKVVWAAAPEAGANLVPIADAGQDVAVFLPATTATLSGTKSQDPDGTIKSYSWVQTAGPNTATIVSKDAATTDLSGLVKGSYTFELAVTDAVGATGKDQVTVTVMEPEQGDFPLLAPLDKAMITDTRTPTFTWTASPGATGYEVHVNITRTDYDWFASGNLLDRYTKVGTVTGTSFTMDKDLPDRWTYRWYVIATGATAKQSARRQFTIYKPYLEQVADGVSIVTGSRDCNKNGTIEPYEDYKQPIDVRIADLMGRMSDAEKFGQLYYGAGDATANACQSGWAFSYGVTQGMLTTQQCAAKTPLGIPVGFSGDKVHGWKTVYPTQLGMAATRNLDLVYKTGDLQRREHKAGGFTGSLSPLAEVNTKVKYPRVQEGCGEDADFAAAMVRAMVAGMQGGPELNPKSMLPTVKHWPGEGAGGEGAIVYDAVTIKYHMKPWWAAMDANCGSIMPGYAGAKFLDPVGNAGAGSSKPIMDYLRKTLGFTGIIVTDWLPADTATSSKSIGAGADVMGGAPADKTDMAQLLAAVGRDRFEEAVRRVLDAKFRLGMFENPYADPDFPTSVWHSEPHQQIALDSVRQSLTLLKNDPKILPLKLTAGQTLVVAGPRANESTGAAGDCNVIWQSCYHDNPQAKNYFQGISERGKTAGVTVVADAAAAAAAVVVIGEKAYTHATEWADKQITFPADQIAVIDKYKNLNIPVIVVVVMPRQYVLTDIMPKAAAVVLAYRPGNHAGRGVAELLFGDFKPTGKLPFQLPTGDDQVGADNGSTQAGASTTERWDLPFDLGATADERTQIRALIDIGAKVPPTFGKPLFQYGSGMTDF